MWISNDAVASSRCCIGVNVAPVFSVVQHGVPVRERAALGVLAGEPDRDAVDEQRRERERLGLAPVDAALARSSSRRRSSCFISFGCGVNQSGTRSSCSFSSRSLSAGDRGDDRRRPLAAGMRPSGVGAGAEPNVSFSASCAALSLRQHARLELVRLLLRQRRPPRRARPRTARARSDARRSRPRAAAACRRPRPARCARGGGSRRGRRRRRGRSGGGTRSRAGSAEIAASGSSALTWMIGMSKPFARSLE